MTAEALTLITTDPFGRRAMTLTWRDSGLTVEKAAPFVPDFIRPENILADITIAYWPEAAVRAGLAGSGATLLRPTARRRVIAAQEAGYYRGEFRGRGRPGPGGLRPISQPGLRL